MQHRTYYTESTRFTHYTKGLILTRRPHTARTTFPSSTGQTPKQGVDGARRSRGKPSGDILGSADRARAATKGGNRRRAPHATPKTARPSAREKTEGLAFAVERGGRRKGLLLSGGAGGTGSLRSAGGSRGAGRLRSAGGAGHARGAGGSGEAGSRGSLGTAVRACVKVCGNFRAALGALYGAARINSCWSEAHEEILSLLR